MLTEFQLSNFKAFAGPENIPIRPITLIFGPNSSGKSSIFQCLLMLKQTLEQTDIPETPLLFAGDLVDLGNYSEFIHRHEVDRTFSLKVMMPIPKDIFLDLQVHASGDYTHNELFLKLQESIANYKSIGMNISFVNRNYQDTIISNIELFLGNFSTSILSYEQAPLDDILSEEYKHLLTKYQESPKLFLKVKNINYHHEYIKQDAEKIKEELCRLLDIDIPSKELNITSHCFKDDIIQLDHFLPLELNGKKFHDIIFEPTGPIGIPWEEMLESKGLEDYIASYRAEEGANISILTLGISYLFRKFLKNLRYIGPQREYPERVFSFSGIQTQYVGKSGKFVPDLLITDQELKDRVNYWFGRLKVKYKLEVFPLANSAAQIHDLFTLRLVDPDSGVLVGLTDVGYGISQVLPVIIQSLISKGKTILIEQPELHLHPGLQAELGDMFIESALGGRRNTFLIETHSEHLILRIMRRMRDTFNGTLPKDLPPIRPQDVAVLYVEKDGPQSIVREMPLNERGELVKAWPGGFFEEALEEVLA